MCGLKFMHVAYLSTAYLAIAGFFSCRYFILDAYGGVYADLDFEALKPFDSLIRSVALSVTLRCMSHTLIGTSLL